MVKGERRYNVSLPAPNVGRKPANHYTLHCAYRSKKTEAQAGLGDGDGSQEGENGEFPGRGRHSWVSG